MKKLFFAAIISLTIGGNSLAAEKKNLRDIDTKSFTTDTQVMLSGGDKHMALAWWIPNEFWEAILARDATTRESDKKAMLASMSGISLLAVVQADVTELGAFKFYSKEEIENSMVISFSDDRGKKENLSPLKTINPDLEVVLGLFKPILGNAMGNLGNNMHFYVLNDKTNTSARRLDPYLNGKLDIQLSKRDKTSMKAAIEMPLNSLFVPRKCPNGKPAHISWKYCPWNGERLGE